MNEFDLISTYLADLAGPEGLGLIDDAANWSPPAGFDAVISSDTLVEGVHFPIGKFDAALAQKLIRVNISDLVAKGADPEGYLLSLTLNEETTQSQIASFCQGLAKDQKNFGFKLWGGDTTRTSGPNVLSITIIGTVPKGKMVRRSGAKPDDIVCVTGHIGCAYLGLKIVLKQYNNEFNESVASYFSMAYHIPNPPFVFRHGIRSLASSSLDISDGLVADAGHLAKASKVSVSIDIGAIPLSRESSKWVAEQEDQIAARLALATGGDDYQALLTVDPANLDEILVISRACDVNLTLIGSVSSGEGVRVQDENGEIIEVKTPGFTHF